MLKGKSTLVLGDGRTSEKLCSVLGPSAMSLQTVSELQKSGLEKSTRCKGLILYADDIPDQKFMLETLGKLCSKNRRFGKSPFPVVLLSAKRDPPIDHEAVREAMDRHPLRISLRSIPVLAARRLLRRFPLHLSVDSGFRQIVHVLIVGFSDLGIAIALHAMRMAHYGVRRPVLTIASLDPERDRDEFFSEFPEARSVAEIDFVAADLSALKTEMPVTSVYICDTETTDRALLIESIRESLYSRQTTSPPMFLELGDDPTSEQISGWDGQTYPFSALSEVCEPEVLFGDSEDELAAIIHDYYRDSIAAQGRSLEGNPAGEPWERLDESYRQASRHQADHMAAKVAAIDCRFVPEQQSEFFVFFPREVEKLARIEHDRWSADRYLNGWKYGPVRDNEKKFHPELIPYDALSEDMKDLDRYTVRLMPALLGRKGLAIRRNLIVAISTASRRVLGKGALKSLHSAFGRLTERYPDRTLVLAIDLGDLSQRFLARVARDQFQAAVWSLIGEPLDSLLNLGESERTRIECLETLAYSERRISVNGSKDIDRWLEERADVALILDRQKYAEKPGAEQGTASALRRVILDPETGITRWSFEY